MDDLRWDDLRAFLAVARRGTLAAAADDLGVNASTVHRRLAALEESLGARLFERDPRGYTLTPLGESLQPKAVEVEEGVAALRRAVTGHDLQASGVVRVSLPPTLVPVVAPALAELQATCPGLEPELLATPAFVDLRRDTHVALRIAAAPPEEAIARRIGPVGWAVYAPPGADGSARVAYVGLDHVSAVAWADERHRDLRVVARVDEVSAARDALRSVRALCPLPCYVGDAEPGLERRSEVLPDPPLLWVLISADLRRSARVRALLDAMLPVLEAAIPRLAG